MKHTYFVVLLIFASCTFFQSNQRKAEGLAKKYLDSALGIDKYEETETSKIDTLRAGPDNEPAYKLITAKIDSTYKIDDELNKRLATTKNYKDVSILQKASQENYNKRKILLTQSLQYLFNSKGKPEGWIIEETFRLKNGVDSSLYVATFKIDDKITKVLSQQTTKDYRR